MAAVALGGLAAQGFIGPAAGAAGMLGEKDGGVPECFSI